MPDIILAIEDHLRMNLLTEIISAHSMNYEPGDFLNYTVARGAVVAQKRRQYVRPMFQVMPVTLEPPKGVQVPCQACGDFARSWNCPEHHR